MPTPEDNNRPAKEAALKSQDKGSPPELKEICPTCGAVRKTPRGSMTAWILDQSSCNCLKEASCRNESAHQALSLVPDPELTREASLPERFEVLSLVGEGGMGKVYRVMDRKENKIAAIKVLRNELIEDDASINRFKKEASASIRLNHPGIIDVYEQGITANGNPFLIMEYLDGESLDQRLGNLIYLEEEECLSLFIELCDALDYAHQERVIHRDLKPSNIVLSKGEDGKRVVKLIDFGIAKVRESENSETNLLTQTGDIFGSPLYMSPEQGLAEKITERSDIYSLGCIMYEALTGSTPFADDNPIKTVYRQLNEPPAPFATVKPQLEISESLEKVVLKCLEKNPEKRYRSVKDLRTDLERVGQGKEIHYSVSKIAESSDLKESDSIKRVLAFILDFLICTFISAFLEAFLTPLIVNTHLFTCWSLNLNLNSPRVYFGMVESLIVYYIFFETIFATTPGKNLFGLVVTDNYGERLPVLKVVLRNVLKILGFIPVILYQLITLTKNVMMDDHTWRTAFRDFFQLPIYDRLSKTRLREGHKGRRSRMLLLTAIIFVPLLLRVLPTADFLFSSGAYRQAPFLETEIRVGDRIKAKNWLTRHYINAYTLRLETKDEPLSEPDFLSKRSKVLITGIKDKFQVLTLPPSIEITDRKDGSQRVRFDETEVERSADGKSVTARTMTEEVEARALFTLERAEVKEYMKVDFTYPDGRTETRKLEDAGKIEVIMQRDAPMDLVWVKKEDGSLTVSLNIPDGTSDYDLANFMDRTASTHDENRAFASVSEEPYYNGLKWQRAFPIPDDGSWIGMNNRRYQGLFLSGWNDPEINSLCRKGSRYNLNFLLNERYGSNGLFKVRVSAGNQSRAFSFDTTEKSDWQNCSIDFTARSNVENIKIEVLESPGKYGSYIKMDRIVLKRLN